MLTLTRKIGESVIIGGEVKVTLLAVGGTKIKIGFTAPSDIPIHREEVYRKIVDSPSAGSQGSIIEFVPG
ncbi:carbon storage regulator CsrA [Pseudidiomarina sp. 1APP75-27a]|nr:carbon storage regulator CsrA [Pseudidiomarina sp. 1APP75-27a]MEA3588437.1 carbon storage regulator CsrA [Pseudidiomarina sp. 1APP75-27a]